MQRRYGEALEDLRRNGRCAAYAFLSMPAAVLPWTDTGLRVAVEQNVTLLATGHCSTMPGLGRGGGPQFYLWRRISPGGRVAKGARATTSFACDREGSLELAILHGEWARPGGDLATPPELYTLAEGAIAVTAIAWGEGIDAASGLAALRESIGDDDVLVEAEIQQLAHPVHRPEGWSYLWLLGDSDIFTADHLDGHDVIQCCTRANVAILRRSCKLDTTEDATLTWRWRVDKLPSVTREDALDHHDYMSIAVEWECGRDITYMWSASLPVGTVFPCPIPQWTPRETHVVVRSGTEETGFWCEERRNLYHDYVDILGEKPGRVVAVWLIAVSIFQHGEGRAAFGPIRIHAGGSGQDFV